MVRYDPSGGGRHAGKRDWEAEGVRALRRHLGLSQQQMAAELGTRQQTVSEGETGLYRPRGGGGPRQEPGGGWEPVLSRARGAPARLLTIIAEQAGFQYEAGKRREETG